MNIFLNRIGYYIFTIGLIFSGIFLLNCKLVSAEACAPGTISTLDSCAKVVGKAITPPGLKEFLDGPTVTKCPNTHQTFHGCYSKDGKNYLCCENENAPAALKACEPATFVDGNYYVCDSTQNCTKAGGTKVAEISGQNNCGSSLVCCQTPVSPTSASTSTSPTPKTYKLTNPLGNVTDLRVIARSVINTFLGIVGALALLVFVYAGLSYLIAGGNDQMVTKAKSTMKYGVIGVALIMLSYVLTDSFVTLWTKDLPASQPAGSGVPAESPTQAEQEVSDLLSQQQAAGEASAAAQAQAGAETGGVQDPEAAAKVSAKSSKTDVCGSTPATQGYSCMLIKSADKPNYNCLSGYCQSNSASNYLCCKQK